MISDKDINNLAWTMLGEARPGDTEGMTAVGNTVLNRLTAGNYGGRTITGVVMAPNQYATWGIGSQAKNQAGHPDTKFPVGSPQFEAAKALAQQLISGQVADNTGGATDYRAASLGTKWAKGADTVNIGGNIFKTGTVDSTGLAYSTTANAGVKATQQALKDAGVDITVDGRKGPQTTAAIKAFQQANGLTVDGKAGPMTQAALAASKGGNAASAAAQQALLGNPAPINQAAPPGSLPIHVISVNPDGTPVAAPGGPAAITGPQASAPKLVTLPSGAKIAPGTYPSSNPGHNVVIADDGTGKAVITHPLNPGEIPGVIDPLHEPPGTIAGDIVSKTVKDMAAKAAAQASTAVQAAAPGLAQQAVGTVQNAGTQALNYLGGLFGGGSKAAAPVNSLAAGGAAKGVSTATGTASLHPPDSDSVGPGAGSYAALQSALASVASYKPTTTYTTQQMVKDNPNYLSYIAAQKADPIGAGPGSFASLQNALGTTAGAPPPRTITTTQQVAHTAPDEALRAVQQTLASQGYYTGAIDGLYGPKTQAAIDAAKAAVPAAPAAPVNALAPALPNVAGNGPVQGTNNGGYTTFNGDNGVAGNSGNWFNDVRGLGDAPGRGRHPNSA